jgi:ATP/maltotriose-dependent transcriptional regulator MalT
MQISPCRPKEAPIDHAFRTRPARRQHRLVGRAGELALLEQALDDIGRGAPAIELVGEPGIGKTRLLAELGDRAARRGYLVLSGSASELEDDLPFSAFVHALDEYVESLDLDRLTVLDADVQAELAHVLPSLSALADGRTVSLQHERYRSHRAVRALLERLADTRPLVLALDDFHWADSASVELLGALLRRPPAAAVLLAISVRTHRMPERLASALEWAYRAETLTRIEVGGLTPAEARELLADRIDASGAAVLYEESGGNPFYLEQLARPLERRDGGGPAAEISPAILGVPPAVAASLGEELGSLSRSGRHALEGAAVAGDPFEPELAAAAAGLSEADVVSALDELLEADLVRTTDVPRRFRFRHPLVRRAVYETTAGGWRLGAHERCAEALAARGATAAVRAHHVEQSAREGDLAAVAVLSEAGDAAARLAPESAARWFGDALRLLPQSAPVTDRIELLLVRARALAAAGHFAAGHQALLEAIALAPSHSCALYTTLATACAGVERQLGRYEQAHDRLVTALRELRESATVESVNLLIELALNEFYRSRYQAMHGWAARAVSLAKVLDDRVLTTAALVMPAFAFAMTGPTTQAQARRAEAAALVDALSDDELSRRPDAASWLAAVEIYLDLYPEADAHGSRALELVRTTGGGDPLFRLYPIMPRIWYVRGKLAESAELLDGAIEAGRLLGSPPALAGNLFNRSAVAAAAGDLEFALANAEEAVELTRELDDGFVSAWAAVRLAAVLLETGEPARAVELLVGRAGGAELALIPGGWRAYGLELLTRCRLALDHGSEAGRAAATAESVADAAGLPLAAAWAARATAALHLHAGDADRAVERALASAAAAEGAGAPIESGLSRTLAGRALARGGQVERAVMELSRAADGFEDCGALRYRELAERELGKLGHRPHRRTRAGKDDGSAMERLTEREAQVARLVVDRKTNPEIAADLFLSQKTVETHLRNIFRKIGVNSRVELARAVMRDDLAARPPTRV